MKNGKITLEVDNECMEFDVMNIMKSTPIEVASRIDSLDVIDECIEEVIYKCLGDDSIMPHDMQEVSKQVLDMTQYQPFHKISRFEPLKREDDSKVTTSTKEVELELKPLPSNLRYAFLDSNFKFPFIVNSSLSNNDVNALCDELNNHKNAVGYSIVDLKGIGPNLCMHRIILDDHAKPSIEGQRRLNPTLKEVVRKEVIKLLDNGIIYSISDSNWVSPVQVVPKKGGLTVVRNESNDLIPTRTVT